jgi:hypothetical protein
MWVGRRGEHGLGVEQHMKQLRKRQVVFSSEHLNTLPSAEALTSNVASPDPLWRGVSAVGLKLRVPCIMRELLWTRNFSPIAARV